MKRKIAIIVGASGSLGTELVRIYLKNKYHVIAVTNNHDVDITSSNITRLKYNLVLEKDYKELVELLEEEVNKNTEINIIYAPGIYYKVNIEDFEEEKLNENIKINVLGFINIYKAIFNILKRVHITNVILIGTNLLVRKNKGSLYYTLSKGMQRELVKQLSYEHSQYNILFNQISPGMFISNMNDNTSIEKIKKIEENIPIKRLGTKDEVALSIYHFASTNTLVTGEEIVMDGGNTIGY
jgi:3-oxoacyl-[acyl-carrier protein] reductase